MSSLKNTIQSLDACLGDLALIDTRYRREERLTGLVLRRSSCPMSASTRSTNLGPYRHAIKLSAILVSYLVGSVRLTCTQGESLLTIAIRQSFGWKRWRKSVIR
jgi:hypothetical protein